jgi:hypothetical protein
VSDRLRAVVERLDLHPAHRSATMIAAASRRNARDRRFDRIFAVRVGLFHREPARARALAERWLAPDGRLLSEYDGP